MDENQNTEEKLSDEISETATHKAGEVAATAMGGTVGKVAYNTVANTKLGKTLEQEVAKKFKFKVKLISALVLFSCSILFLVFVSYFIDDGTFGDSSGELTYVCDDDAAELLAMMVSHEVGAYDNTSLFTMLTTASIVVNNAGGDTYEEIYALNDNNYQGFSGYKNSSLDVVLSDFSGDLLKQVRGRLLYVAQAVLSGKFNLPSNMALQASPEIVGEYGFVWDHEPVYIGDLLYGEVYFGYSLNDDGLSNVDVFGNSLPEAAYSDINSSVEYYKRLASSLEKDDYSSYTTSSVCKEYSNKCVNLPSIDSVCKSITPTGYETMSVDEYVAGVINAEIGGYTDDNFNTYKSLAVAARSFALYGSTKDNNGNCTVPVGPTFQAYAPNPSQDMINAANETSGIVLTLDNKIVSAQYDALCIYNEDGINYYLCQGGIGEEHLVLPKEWIVSMTSQSYIDYIRNYTHGNGLSQNGAWYLAKVRGWDYNKILDYFYGDDGIAMSSITGSKTICSSSNNGNFEPLENYNLRHEGLDVLNKKLSSDEVESANDYINSEVDKAGYGTGAGVAAAGQAMVYWLEQNGYYLSYYWGGGQGGGEGNNTFIGFNPKWGSTEFGTDYNNSAKPRPYYGLDCSGFTSWAVRTACAPNSGARMAGYWYNLSGVKHIKLSEAKPGDMLDSENHVQLVVKNNGDGSVIVAEATGGDTSGVVFSLIQNTDYYVVDMSGWYSANCSSGR